MSGEVPSDRDAGTMTGRVLSDPDVTTMMALPGELLTSGTTRHVWLNSEWKPSRLDKNVPKLYDALKDTLLGRKE